ncbi:MAG: arylsulfatase [Puniceicoccaceae bacterium]
MSSFWRQLVLQGACLLLSGSLHGAQAREQPNVVIIYGDDVGHADIGANGGPAGLPTPNIDRLAEEGINFTDGHSSAATCTPSRFSMLTGVHAFRHNVNVLPPNGNLTVPAHYITLPQIFKKAGYATGIVGKWHLGFGEREQRIDWNGELKPGPLEVGFDYAFLLPNTNDRVPCVYVEGHRVVNLDPEDPIHVGNTYASVNIPGSTAYPDARANDPNVFYQSIVNGLGRIGYTSGGKSALWDDYTMAEEFVARATDFIETHREQPFFLYFSSQDIHYPFTPNERHVKQSDYGKRGDVMVQLDWSVGKILGVIERLGLKENTIVIFTSDNGPVNHKDQQSGNVGEHVGRRTYDASGPWRGGKFQIYEGGTRVPLIIRWPGKISPGQSSAATISQIDFPASFADLLGIELKAAEARDSRNVLGALLGQDPEGTELLIEECRGPAIRLGPWKYIPAYSGKWVQAHDPKVDTLYNLQEDPGEQSNVIADYPEVAASLKHLLDRIKAGEGVRELEVQAELTQLQF